MTTNHYPSGRTAIFLGAGASCSFGYPQTPEILPKLLRRLDANELFDGANATAVNTRDRDWMRERLYAFLPGLRDAWKHCRNGGKLAITITDVLTLVDRGIQQADARARMSAEDLTRFRRLLERGVYESLLRNSDRRKKEKQASLDDFSSWMCRLNQPVGIVTTNYDTAVDQKLFRLIGGDTVGKWEASVATAIDFGFPWRRIKTGVLVQRPANPSWQLLKLHGSVNWLHCSLCGQIYQNVRGAIGSKAFSYRLHKWNLCHCNGWLRLNLHLVTPSLVRQTNDANLLGIYQAAMETLRLADHWVIVGYSLPQEDVAIRSLFLKAWEGRYRKPKVTVVNGSREDIELTYRSFFPERSLTYYRDKLDDFLQHQRELARKK